MRSCVKPEGNDGASEAPKIDSRTPAVTRDQLRTPNLIPTSFWRPQSGLEFRFRIP